MIPAESVVAGSAHIFSYPYQNSYKFGTIRGLNFLRNKRTMFEINPVINAIKDIRERTDALRGYL